MADAGFAEQFEQMTIIKNEEIAKLKEENAKLKEEIAELKKPKESDKGYDEDYKALLIHNVNELLKQTGITQATVAEELGVSQMTVSGCLSGNRPISNKNCKKLAEWLDKQDEATGWTKERKTALIARFTTTLKEKGIFQKDAAEELGVAQSTVTYWLQNKITHKYCDRVDQWIQDKQTTV